LLIFLEYAGAALSLIGAIMVSKNNNYSKWGFVIFTISNLLLGLWAYQMQAWGLLALNCAFMCINAYGIIKWFNIKSLS
jgi:hypothetical protein